MGEALATWLESMPWDYFWTVTSRRPRRDALALIRDVSHHFRSLDYASALFIACEPHRLSRNLHAHGLYRSETGTQLGLSLGVPSPGGIWEGLFYRFGRSRVEPIRSTSEVSAYCSKYVTKLCDPDDWAIWKLGNSDRQSYPETSEAVRQYRPEVTPFSLWGSQATWLDKGL